MRAPAPGSAAEAAEATSPGPAACRSRSAPPLGRLLMWLLILFGLAPGGGCMGEFSQSCGGAGLSKSPLSGSGERRPAGGSAVCVLVWLETRLAREGGRRREAMEALLLGILLAPTTSEPEGPEGGGW